MADGKFIPYAHIKKSFCVSNTTLKNWEKQGLLNTVRLPGGKRLYSEASINACLNIPEKPRSKFIYARVSSPHQKPDLDRQVAALQSAYPEHSLITDIGSGLNWERKGFTALLDHIHAGDCDEVVVAHKDRLCRFGYEFVEWLAQKHHCTIVVHDQAVDSAHQIPGDVELADDLLSVVTVFTARNNGLRSTKNKRRRVASVPEAGPAPDPSPTPALQQVDGRDAVCV